MYNEKQGHDSTTTRARAVSRVEMATIEAEYMMHSEEPSYDNTTPQVNTAS